MEQICNITPQPSKHSRIICLRQISRRNNAFAPFLVLHRRKSANKNANLPKLKCDNYFCVKINSLKVSLAFKISTISFWKPSADLLLIGNLHFAWLYNCDLREICFDFALKIWFCREIYFANKPNLREIMLSNLEILKRNLLYLLEIILNLALKLATQGANLQRYALKKPTRKNICLLKINAIIK